MGRGASPHVVAKKPAAGILVAAIACLALTGCPGPVPLVPLAPDPDGAVPATVCERACSRLAALNCPESRPTERGLTCVQVCESTPAYALDPACVAEATTQAGLRACGVCQ